MNAATHKLGSPLLGHPTPELARQLMSAPTLGYVYSQLHQLARHVERQDARIQQLKAQLLALQTSTQEPPCNSTPAP